MRQKSDKSNIWRPVTYKRKIKNIDFSKIDKDLFMIATIKSVSGDTFMLKDLLRENIV